MLSYALLLKKCHAVGKYTVKILITKKMENKYNLDDFNTFSSRTNQFQESEEENKSKAANVIVDFNLQEHEVSERIKNLISELEKARCLKNSLNSAVVAISEQVSFDYPVVTNYDGILYVIGEDLNALKVSDGFI